MPSAFEHGPALTVPASNTTAKAAVIWSAASNLGESTIILDSGGNGRIGIAGDLDTITITSGTVTVAGTVAATTLTGAGSGITALNGTQITSGTLPAARIGADSIVEGKLDVSNAPTNGYFLQAQSGEGGGLTWAAASSGPSQANQAAIEAETNQDTYIPPDLMKYHPGVAKVWIRFYQSNSSHTMGASYGVASIADGGAAGFSDFTWSTAFSSAEYAILVSAEAASVSGMEAGSKAAGTVTVRFWDMNGTYNDALHGSVACFGDL